MTTSAPVGPAWRRVAAIVTVAIAAWVILITLASGEIIPPVVIIAVAFIVAWGFTRWRPNRITFGVFGGIGLATVLTNIPFVLEDLSHPESAFGFSTTLLILLASILAVLVGIAAWRSFSERTASRAAMAAGAILVVGIAVSTILALGLEDDPAVAGDIQLSADAAEWVPESLSATAGAVAVYVDNLDPIRHTFAIDALDLEVELPASTGRRIEFTASAGSYEFVCTVPGHENMVGTIVVGG
ncbi:MAG: cupredoxin domain-containing protein [Acidimicrobiia bacterium]